MGEVSTHTTSLAHAKFNLDIIFFEITTRETCFSIESFEMIYSRQCYIITSWNDSFYDAEMEVVCPKELMRSTDANYYPRVDPDYLGIISYYIQEAIMEKATFEVGSPSNWSIFTIPLTKRYVASLMDIISLFMILSSRSGVFSLLFLPLKRRCWTTFRFLPHNST